MTESIKTVKKGVYITGKIYYELNPISLSKYYAGYWLDGAWNTLATPPGTVRSHANQIFITSTDVYITGFCEARRITKSGYWKNGEWHTLNTKYKSGIKKSATNIAVAANGDVYITGARYEGWHGSLLMMHAGYWLNSNWHDLPVPVIFNHSTTNGISIDNGNVYIGGFCRDINHHKKITPCYWLNGRWHGLPVIADNSHHAFRFVSEGNIYTLERYAGYWVNDTWHELPQKGDYGGIAVSGNNVYVLGIVDNNVGYWHNEKWSNLPKPADDTDIFPYSIAISDNDVYITGVYCGIDEKKIMTRGPLNHPCYWRNGILHLLAEPAGVIRSETVAVAVVTK